MNFQERFKGKTSTVSRLGELNLTSVTPVAKSHPRSAFQASAHLMLKAEQQFQTDLSRTPATTSQSAANCEVASLPERRSAKPPQLPASNAFSTAKARSTIHSQGPREYVPYTLKDYRLIQPTKYYQLGGLGAYSIGTAEWKAKKEVLDRRNQYARNANAANFGASKRL